LLGIKWLNVKIPKRYQDLGEAWIKGWNTNEIDGQVDGKEGYGNF
jgi:hypothetical protein